jgi:hypothetical protein
MKRLNEELLAIVIFLFIGFLTGVVGCEIFVVKRMKRDSLEGYKSKATYVTNSLGEITIDKITWSK